MSAIPISSFLRTALLVDAGASAATGLLLAAGASSLSSILGLPSVFLMAAGLPLLPFAAFVAWLGTRSTGWPAAIHLVVWANAVWVAASIVVVAARVFEPTILGVGFILAQAAAVGAFATFQFVGLRRVSHLTT
jgi:hypothetical protein